MAEDFRISASLFRHPKFRKLEKRLGDAGCLSLFRLFGFAAGTRADGNLAGMSDEDIELAAEWPGETGAFIRTLVEVRFVDGVAGAYSIHDWAEHQPWCASRGQRVEAARKAAVQRWEMERGMRDASGPHAERMPDACAAHETAMPTTQPYPDAAHAPAQPCPTTPEKQNLLSETSVSDVALEHSQKNGKAVLEAQRLTQLLLNEILRNKPDFKTTEARLEKWAEVAERIIRLDKRTEAQAEPITCVARMHH